ncbi:MAG: succinylglutamate desuccinylase/aspartoacylase family protein, partial [Pseudomonadales bacterium]
MKSAFRIYDREVQPGSRVSFDLKVPELYVHSDLSTPVHVINGKREGPVLFISGAVHGDEIIGVEIVRRVLASKQLRNLKGTLIAIPVVNIFGFLNQSRYLPDRRDLNRSFPGSAKGSIASRMANLFFEQVVEKSAYGIDLHTAAINRENLPQVRANVEDAEVEGMARAFGLPVIVNSGLIEGSLRASAGEVGVKMIVYEAGEALRFDEKAIRAGVNGVLKVMQHLGMIRKSSRRSAATAEPTLTNQSSWMRAP